MAASAAWSHRWGALSWIAGAGGFLAYFGIAYKASVASYPGGPAAFGLAAAPISEAMRPFSGVADRLDTYGGYVTYHNASIAAFLLSLWAVIQGTRAIRGWEERGGTAVWLAAGSPRRRVVVDQWVGTLAALAVIAMGIAAGFGIGAAAADVPNWGGAFVVGFEMALVAATFFGIGMLGSQLTRTARAGAGLTSIVMVALYLAANMSTEIGWFGWMRYLSPFFYFQQSRVLIPGHAFDLAATLVLVGAAIVPVFATTLAFEHRDLGASLLGERESRARISSRKPVHIASIWRRDVWLADIRSQWVALGLWAFGSALTMFVVTSAAKQVTEIWQNSELIKQLFMRVPGSTLTDQYMTYVTIVAALAPVAFVVAEAARWVGDLTERRAETMLSVSGSRLRIVLEWAASAVAGIVIVVAAVLLGALAGAAAAGVSLRADSVIRTGADAILLGIGICGAALLAVVVFKNGSAVGALGAVLGLGFFISLLAPMFNWPDWVVRLSPFDAFGTPYSAVPRPSGIALLAFLALAGGAASALIAQRRSTLT